MDTRWILQHRAYGKDVFDEPWGGTERKPQS